MINVAVRLQRDQFHLNASFAVAAKGVTGLFGPSGCGKTSLLRAIAGLEPTASGRIAIRDQIWQDSNMRIPAEQRRVGVVFQDASLFPHLSVRGNLLYARSRAKKAEHLFDLEHISEILGVSALLDRSVAGLSGGERQRVAIGRALLASPTLLLMDEPLSALDQAARRSLMSTLEKIFQEFEIPVLYVSHASDEVARLADNLVLMEKGAVQAFGELSQVLGEIDSPLSHSDEAFSVLHCQVHSHELDHLTTVVSKGGETLHIPRQQLPAGSDLRLRVRARDVSLCLQRPTGSSILNILAARVQAIGEGIEQGSRTIKLDIGGESLLARVSEHSIQTLQISPEMVLFAQVKSVSFSEK